MDAVEAAGGRLNRMPSGSSAWHQDSAPRKMPDPLLSGKLGCDFYAGHGRSLNRPRLAGPTTAPATLGRAETA